ncbi:MAG: hypothetical protein RIS17_1083, partial [Pseudomonadota bacterium]
LALATMMVAAPTAATVGATVATTQVAIPAPADAPAAMPDTRSRDSGPLVAGVTGIIVLALAFRRRKPGLPEVVS